jgi:LmbE family N-acetylglucosaminyl deacetylase
VLVSYDEDGFYGHPDHIQAHRAGRRAFRAGRRARSASSRHCGAQIGAGRGDRPARDDDAVGGGGGGGVDFRQVESVTTFRSASPTGM